ncbi:uncharacterized protein LOC123538787 [Mercenaria mercenaria]|uniref:uncharacterized protein LOC123538787 n=1 Tax=Mercenaria mercenaria TaxID=6596 RepID=UPI00234FA067|nr:uncharacterized protein LOC123538787 [Mercenaria mercenaria]XP_053386413.1 uncharacterized protein LOC123538787 [Mercenaria mercenaria]
MSEEEDYDPNAGVPLWVNILVPILSGLLFVAVLVILFHTKKEVPLETIEDWVEKIPILNRYLSPDWQNSEDETTAKTKSTARIKTTDKTRVSHKSYLNERSSIRKSLSHSDIRRYDSISSIRTRDNTFSSRDLQNPTERPYFYASQGTLLSFESNV